MALGESQVPEAAQIMTTWMTCIQCGQTGVAFTQEKMGAADEPVKRFCSCSHCAKRWIIMIDSPQAAESAAVFPKDGYKPATFPVPEPGSAEFAKFFDHTILKLDATAEQVDKVCDEARQFNFKSVCIRPNWVERCVKRLEGCDTIVGCTVGFHEGTYKTAEKVNEAMKAVSEGAKELDMVMNYPQLIAGDYTSVQADIEAVRAAAPAPIVLKVIVETSQLNVSQILKACEIVKATKADFIKTSTGFNGRGASVEDIQIMRYGVGDACKIKASGGVRTVSDAVNVIAAGANRIGASAGVTIMEEAKSGKKAEGGGSGY